MPSKRVAPPIVAPGALRDIREILEWSEVKFGKAAAQRYRVLIKQAMSDVAADPERPGSKQRPDIMIEGARIYHLQFSRNRVAGQAVKEPRHVLLYRRREDGVVEVARVLHDGRDLLRNLPEDYARPAAAE